MGGSELPVAFLPIANKVTMIQMNSKLPIDQFEKVVELAVEGCRLIHKLLKQAIEEHTLQLVESRGLLMS